MAHLPKPKITPAKSRTTARWSSPTSTIATILGGGTATIDVWLRHSHDGGDTWASEQHLFGPFDHYRARISNFAPGDPRNLFLGDYVGLETISGDNVISLFSTPITDGADVTTSG